MDNFDLPLTGVENEQEIPFIRGWKNRPEKWNEHLNLQPQAHLHPDEFWKDEAGKADGYANVYLPFDTSMVRNPAPDFGYRIHHELETWLNENAGTRRAYGLDWYQNTPAYDWYVRGSIWYKDQDAVQICIRDLDSAMVFKLIYGGL